MLVLVWDRHRGMGTGFKPSEGWEIASNTFAHTGTTEARNQIMDAVESAWNANKARDIVFLRFALNNALHAANYRTMAGGDVNSSDPEVT